MAILGAERQVNDSVYHCTTQYNYVYIYTKSVRGGKLCDGLTVGGFTQPAVARSLIELPSNIEKGLSTRFLWIFPKPCYAKFESLEPVNEDFSSALGT